MTLHIEIISLPRSVSLKLKILAALLLPSFLAMNGCSNFPFFTTLNNVQMQYGFMCWCKCVCVCSCLCRIARHGTCVTRNTATYYKIYYTFSQTANTPVYMHSRLQTPKISQCNSLCSFSRYFHIVAFCSALV